MAKVNDINGPGASDLWRILRTKENYLNYKPNIKSLDVWKKLD